MTTTHEGPGKSLGKTEHAAESGALAGCCSACNGYGRTTYEMCWDCRGTGCAHPEPLCVTPPAKRIQRKRTKGWRMPEGAVYVGRPTKWGNPYVVGAVLWDRSVYATDGEVRNAQHAVDLYRRWLVGSTGGARTGHGPISSAFLTMGDPRDLAGKDLACWCPLDQPCHADVLLEIANAS